MLEVIVRQELTTQPHAPDHAAATGSLLNFAIFLQSIEACHLRFQGFQLRRKFELFRLDLLHLLGQRLDTFSTVTASPTAFCTSCFNRVIS